MIDKYSGRTRVKICGMTQLADAEKACKLGVDALGFIFYAKSPRSITPLDAGEIIKELPPFVDRVGVFVNGSKRDIDDAVNSGLSFLQLHGTESPAECERIRLEYPHCRIIKAFRVSEESRPADFSIYDDLVDSFLLDTYVKGASGGTGQIFDWTIVEKLELQRPILLAGGLSVDNISQAITQIRPYGVDVNSGIETAPGVKDHEHMEKLMGLVAKSSLG